MAQVLSENITSSTVSQLKRANPINASTCICIGYCPVWRVLWVYNTHDKSCQGRSPRPLFSRVLYTHNTHQTGQYLIYTIVTMYKANSPILCMSVKTVKTRKPSFIKILLCGGCYGHVTPAVHQRLLWQ